MTYTEPVAQAKSPEIVGQLIGSGNFSAFQHDGDHGDVALEGGRDLDPHEIVGTIKASSSIFVAHIQPLVPDNREQGAAFGNLFLQHFDEIDPEGNPVNVHKQEIAAKLASQPIVDASCVARAVLAAIADEDLGCHRQSVWRNGAALVEIEGLR
jgi:hypothetical protein